MQARGGTLVRDNRTVERRMNSGVSKGRLSIHTITKKNGGVVFESGRDQLQLSIYCEDAWGTDRRVSMCRTKFNRTAVLKGTVWQASWNSTWTVRTDSRTQPQGCIKTQSTPDPQRSSHPGGDQIGRALPPRTNIVG